MREQAGRGLVSGHSPDGSAAWGLVRAQTAGGHSAIPALWELH